MNPIYIFDLDGTLCNHEHRVHLALEKRWDEFSDACVWDGAYSAVLGILNALAKAGAEIWFVTGRSERVRLKTIEWLRMRTNLRESDIAPNLHMRAVGDHRDDDKLKQAWFRSLDSVTQLRIECVFEDRDRVVAMWRSNGVPCLQVRTGDF